MCDIQFNTYVTNCEKSHQMQSAPFDTQIVQGEAIIDENSSLCLLATASKFSR